ncbi:MAG: hypothetical protein JWP69_1988 [Flaviaesturariibacter sp.]|nr:hypothetical protein [Flaviaesturariibacter sp.]
MAALCIPVRIYLSLTTAMSSTYIIKTEALNYHFAPGVKTLDNINLSVEKGSIYGFLGPMAPVKPQRFGCCWVC